MDNALSDGLDDKLAAACAEADGAVGAENSALTSSNPTIILIEDSEDGIVWDEQWDVQAQRDSLKTPTPTREPEDLGRPGPGGESQSTTSEFLTLPPERLQQVGGVSPEL